MPRGPGTAGAGVFPRWMVPARGPGGHRGDEHAFAPAQGRGVGCHASHDWLRVHSRGCTRVCWAPPSLASNRTAWPSVRPTGVVVLAGVCLWTGHPRESHARHACGVSHPYWCTTGVEGGGKPRPWNGRERSGFSAEPTCPTGVDGWLTHGCGYVLCDLGLAKA